MNRPRRDVTAKLESVRKSYPSFVEGTMDFIDDFDIEGQIISYIDANPAATASDVIIETHRIVYGINFRSKVP